MLMAAELKGCVTWFIYFLDLLWVRYSCARFDHCRICVTDFREVGAKKVPPHLGTSQKKPILNRFKLHMMIAWNNVYLLVEIRFAKKNWGPKFGPNGAKLDPKLGFLPFSQVWFICFPGNCIGWELGTMSNY